MAKLDTRSTRLGAVLQHEYKPEYGYCRKIVTVTEAAETTYEIGRVIGDGNDTMAAADNFVGIYIGSPEGADSQTVAAATATDVVVLYRGPAGIGAANLVFAADVDDSTKLAAAIAKVEAAGIDVLAQPNQFDA